MWGSAKHIDSASIVARPGLSIKLKVFIMHPLALIAKVELLAWITLAQDYILQPGPVL